MHACQLSFMYVTNQYGDLFFNDTHSALETLEIKRNIMSGEGPFALSSGGRSSVQLLQVNEECCFLFSFAAATTSHDTRAHTQLPMGRTKEQATSLAHMKELFYIGLNTLFLDTSNDPLHRVHQVSGWVCISLCLPLVK